MQSIPIQPETQFQALGDTTRLRIVRLLAVSEEEACSCELADSLLEPAYKLSRHLKILRQAGLLSSQPDGRWVYHRLVTAPAHLPILYALVRALPDSNGRFHADLDRFGKRLALREDGRCRLGILSDQARMKAG